MREEVAEVELSPGRVRALRRRLLRWYDAHHRRLPWRPVPRTHSWDASDRPSPYHVLVSEAMLQQTQVATVIPYFERFIARFPTVHALAEAEEREVLRLWQGLGYYRRARHLHAAAKWIAERFGGEVPSDVATLMTLPGVGRYAAGAIASIAFDRPAPILDGNVARVLARWCAIEEPIDGTATRHRLWALASRLVPGGSRGRAGDFNQALMELGALVCTPRSPRCLTCPVASVCEAHQRGLSETLPRRQARRAPRAVTHHVAAVARGGRYLFEQRGTQSLWANMWQLPTSEALDGQSLHEWVEGRFGLRTAPEGTEHAFTHQTTHRTIRFVVQPMRVTGGRLRRGSGIWRCLEAFEDLPLANPQRRIVRWLQGR